MLIVQSAVRKKRRDSVVLTVNDPVAMHLLVETAIADSSSYDILTYEEVEELKKELRISTNRISALKRKLILETKLQEAASSLNRLPLSGRTNSNGTSPTSPGSSDDTSLYKNGTTATLSRTQSTAGFTVVSTKADEMSEKLAKEESANFSMRRRLLEHTAGVLQLTYNGNGLRNSYPRGYGNASMDGNHSDPHKLNGNMTPESMAHDFSEGSLYRDVDVLDDINIDNEGMNARDGLGVCAGTQYHHEQDLIRDTKGKLGLLCKRVHGVLQESGVDCGLVNPPEDSADIRIQLAYLEKSIESVPSMGRSGRGAGTVSGDKSEQMIVISATARINDILNNTTSKSQERANGSLSQHTGSNELILALDKLEKYVAKLADQKSILTRQIQQQRELNEKSDAERDEYIAYLREEVTTLEGKLGVAKERTAECEREIKMQSQQLQELRQKEVQQKKKNEDTGEAGTSPNHLAELEATRAEVRLHKETAEKLQKDLDAKHSEADTHREARSNLEEQVILKEKEIARHKESLDEFVRQSIDAQNELNALKEQNASIRRELAQKNQLLEASMERSGKVTPGSANRMSSASAMENDEDRLAKDKELRDLGEAVEDMERQLRNKEAEIGMVKGQIASLKKAAAEREQALEAARQSAAASKIEVEGLRGEKETAERALTAIQETLKEKEGEVAELKSSQIKAQSKPDTTNSNTNNKTSPGDIDELNTLRKRVVESDTKIYTLQAELAMAGEAVSIARDNLVRRRTNIEGAGGDTKRVQAQAQARGDAKGKIGSSSVSSLSSSSSSPDSTSMTDLRKHIKMMEDELRETIEDHEGLVKASIEFEREREHLETVIDKLREKCEKLETEISERKLEDVTSDERRGGHDVGMVRQQVSIKALKDEFKKLMRESRREHMRMLRLEQEERKRLEALVVSSRRGRQPLAVQFGADGVSQEQKKPVVQPT
ncbi:hypothetical protein KEM54_006041 [Ascosphaera aggregata]|nr:hypothetical protein KEM54_006041 [Ascosphaera aggregata]